MAMSNNAAPKFMNTSSLPSRIDQAHQHTEPADPRLGDLFAVLDEARAHFHEGINTRRDTQKIIDYLRGDQEWNGPRSSDRNTGAFSPHGAAECVHDFPRTDAFMRAIALHARDLSEERRQAFTVVDAGSGPLGVLGLTAAFASRYAHVTCIELDRVSVESLERIVHRLDLQDRVKVIEADARTWVPDKPIDLLVSETMMGPLINQEYMPAILHHLRGYMSENGRIVPEELTIDGAIEDPATETPPLYKPGQLFDFRQPAKEAPTHVDAIFDFSDTSTAPGRPGVLKIGSTVRLYKNRLQSILLNPHSRAAVNQAIPVKEIYATGGPVGKVHVRYKIGAEWDTWEDRIRGATIDFIS